MQEIETKIYTTKKSANQGWKHAQNNIEAESQKKYHGINEDGILYPHLLTTTNHERDSTSSLSGKTKNRKLTHYHSLQAKVKKRRAKRWLHNVVVAELTFFISITFSKLCYLTLRLSTAVVLFPKQKTRQCFYMNSHILQSRTNTSFLVPFIL